MSWTEEEIEKAVNQHEAELEDHIAQAVAVRKPPLPAELKNCKGRLLLHKDFILNPDSAILSEIFRKFYPAAISEVHISDMIEYFGYSYDFRPIESLGIVPMYRAIFTVSPEGFRSLHEFRELDPDFLGNRDIEDGESDSLEKFEGR